MEIVDGGARGTRTQVAWPELARHSKARALMTAVAAVVALGAPATAVAAKTVQMGPPSVHTQFDALRSNANAFFPAR